METQQPNLSGAAAAASQLALGDSVLERTNTLLKKLGVTDRPFVSLEELQENASSTVVALFEALFITRIGGVRRRPADPADYAWNAGLVIEALQVLLPPKIGFPHDTVTGAVVASGDLTALDYLVRLLEDIHAVITTHGPGAATAGGHGFSSASQDASFATETTATTGNDSSMLAQESQEQQQQQRKAQQQAFQEEQQQQQPPQPQQPEGADALAATEGHGRPATAPHGQARTRPGAAAGIALNATANGRKGSATGAPVQPPKVPGLSSSSSSAAAPKPQAVAAPAVPRQPVPQAVKAALGASPKLQQQQPSQRPTSAVGQRKLFGAGSGSSTVSRSSAYTGTTAGNNQSAAAAQKPAATQKPQPHPQARPASRPSGQQVPPAAIMPQVPPVPSPYAGAPAPRQQQQQTGASSASSLAHLSVAASHGLSATHALRAQLDSTQRKLQQTASSVSAKPPSAGQPQGMGRSHSASATVKEHRRLGLPVPGFSSAALQGVAETTSKTAADLSQAMGGHPFFGHSVPSTGGVAAAGMMGHSATSSVVAGSASAVSASGKKSHGGRGTGTEGEKAPHSNRSATNRSFSSVGLSRSSRGSRMAPMAARFGINPNAGLQRKNHKKEHPGLQQTVSGLPSIAGLEPPALTPAAAMMFNQQQQQQQGGQPSMTATAPQPVPALPPGALRSTTARLAQQSANDIEHISTLHQAAVKSRLAEYARLEASAVRSATLRARAAKHERKVLAARTKRLLEDMARHTLSLRLARSSKQAAAATALLKAYAAQLRAEAADRIRFAAADRQRMLSDQRGSLEAAAQAISAAAEVAKEETLKQMVQRQAALRSQRETLARALAEMRADEEALLQAIKTEQSHAEAAFLAQHVEGLHPLWARGGAGGAGDFDAGAAVVQNAGAAASAGAGGGAAHHDPHLDGHTLRGLQSVVSRGTEGTGTRITSMGRVLSLAAAENKEAVLRANEMASEAGPVHALLVTRANEKAREMQQLGKSIAARTGQNVMPPSSNLGSPSASRSQHQQHRQSSHRKEVVLQREDEEAGVMQDSRTSHSHHHSHHSSPKQQHSSSRHQSPYYNNHQQQQQDDDEGSLDDGASGSFSEAAEEAVREHERALAQARSQNNGRPLAARPEHHRAQQRKLQQQLCGGEEEEEDDAGEFVHHQDEEEEEEDEQVPEDEDGESVEGSPDLVVRGEQMPLYHSPQAAQASSPRASSKTKVVDAEEIVVAEAGAAASDAPLAVEGRGMAGVTLFGDSPKKSAPHHQQEEEAEEEEEEEERIAEDHGEAGADEDEEGELVDDDDEEEEAEGDVMEEH